MLFIILTRPYPDVGICPSRQQFYTYQSPLKEPYFFLMRMTVSCNFEVMTTINFVLVLLSTSILAIAWELSLPHYLRPQPIN